MNGEMEESDRSGESSPSGPPEKNSAPEPRSSDRAEHWQRARRQVYAAQAILISPRCQPRSAVGHLVAAWEALAALYRLSSPDGGDVPEWIRDGRAGIPPKRRAEVAATVETLYRVAGDDPWQIDEALPSIAVLLAHTRELQHLVARADIELLGGAERRRRRRRWLVRGGIAVVVVVAVLAYLRLADTPGTGRWRAAYYRTIDLTGTPLVRRDRDVSFRWGKGRPLDEIPADHFSVRWDTCLGIAPNPTPARFELSADDGAKLFVDGNLLIDSWTIPGSQRIAEVNLPRGVHHLRVEYYEKGGEASIFLRAGFAGGVLRPIPPGILRYPESDIEDVDVCDNH